MSKALGYIKSGLANLLRILLSMTDLFTEFSTGMLDNGSPIPERLSGCKVVSKISSNRSQDSIDVDPDTLW